MPDPFILRDDATVIYDIGPGLNFYPDYSEIATMPDGGFVLAWDATDRGAGYFHFQTYTAAGDRLFAFSDAMLGPAQLLDLAVLANGSPMASWSLSETRSGWVATYNVLFDYNEEGGGKLSGYPFYPVSGTYFYPLSEGGFLSSQYSSVLDAMWIRVHDSAGTVLGPVQTHSRPDFDYYSDREYIPLTDGKVIAIWEQGAASDDFSIVARPLNDQGSLTGTVVTLVGPGSDGIVWNGSTSLANGDFLVTWTAINPLGGKTWMQQRFQGDGTPAGDATQIAPPSEDVDDISINSVAALPDGGWIVSWNLGTDYPDPASGFYLRIRSSIENFWQRYDADGQPVGDAIQIGPDGLLNGGNHENIGLAVQPDGSIITVWTTPAMDGNPFTFSQQTIEGQMIGTMGDDMLSDTPGTDLMFGRDGDDILFGGTGDDMISGGDGDDTAMFTGSRAGAQIARDGGTVTVTAPGQGTDTLTEVEFLQFDDVTLAVSQIGTEISGGDGPDRLVGTDRSDLLIGGAGDDHLAGRGGADLMQGGLGNDRYDVDDAGDLVQGETGYAQGGGIDTVVSQISFTLTANLEILRLQGSEDINGTGNYAPEALVGNAGNNVLDGGGGNDVISGKAGDDTLIGGLGADTLVGDEGADVFEFTNVNESRPGQAGRDFINGFVHGEDKIDLTGIDANVLNASTGENINTAMLGPDVFSFIGNTAFSGTAGELRYFTFGGGNFNIVEADVNGDGSADMQIFVNLTDVMTQSDFIL